MSKFDYTIAVMANKRAAQFCQRELDKLAWIPVKLRPDWIQHEISKLTYELHLYSNRLDDLAARKNAREKQGHEPHP